MARLHCWVQCNASLAAWAKGSWCMPRKSSGSLCSPGLRMDDAHVSRDGHPLVVPWPRSTRQELAAPLSTLCRHQFNKDLCTLPGPKVSVTPRKPERPTMHHFQLDANKVQTTVRKDHAKTFHTSSEDSSTHVKRRGFEFLPSLLMRDPSEALYVFARRSIALGIHLACLTDCFYTPLWT